MLNWLGAAIAKWRATIAAGDSRMVERVYLPAAVGVGVVLGCAISYAAAFLAVLVFLIAGFALGYGTRALVSFRRRQRFARERSF